MIVEVKVKGDRSPEILSAEQAREITECARQAKQVYTISDVVDVINTRANCGLHYALVETECYEAAERITEILYGKHYTTAFRTDERCPVVIIAW